MDWLHPDYFWTLLFLPLTIALFAWAVWQRRKALHAFGDPMLVSKLSESVSGRKRRWKGAIIVIAMTLLVVALVGPRVGTKLREMKREGVDLIIALDVSHSMQAEDVAPNRLERAKNEIKKLLSELRGDRVGLVLFAGDAFIQCPLTTDYNAVRLFLEVADPSLIPTPGTDFEAALRMSIRAFESSQNVDEDVKLTRTLLIVSDGENHRGDLDQILEDAAEANIIVFAAGVGETSGVPIPVYERGTLIGYKRDNAGEVVRSRLEEDALKTISNEGAYFRIARTSSSLPKLPSALDRLEKTEFSSEVFEEYEEQFQWPLLLGLFLLLTESMISDRRKRVNV